MKRTPNGNIDFIGSAIALGSGIVSLIQTAIPDKNTRRLNRAVRQLNRKYKGMQPATYVRLFFSDYTPEQQQQVIDFLTQTIKP